MKTQGVNLMASQVSEIKVTKKSTKQSTNASDSTFDNFISNSANAAKVDRSKTSTDASSQIQTSKNSEEGTSSNKTQSKDAKQDNLKKTDAKDAPKTERPDATKKSDAVAKTDSVSTPEDDIDVEKLNEDVLEILQSVLGLSEQDLTDLFAMVDMEPKDLYLGIQSGEIESFSITTVQTFVMEVHGITDTSAFLTNSDLMQEVNDIFDQMKQLLADLMDVSLDLDGNIDENTWEDFVTKLIAPKAEVNPQPEVQAPVVEADTEAPIAVDDASEGMQVIIENRTDNAGADTGAQTGQGSGLGADELDRTTSDVETMARNVHQENVQNFTDNLTEALNESSQIDAARTNVADMVDQVVRQVRIRVMPETTNMELQLHPASLGRVSVQVNATAEATSARLIVESQSAKEALESGMIRLQEAFEEKGIKVEAVEITVSNFDVATRQDTSGQEGSSESGRGNRRRGGQSAEGIEADAPVDNRTEASRVDVNSTVDYTA